MILPKGNVTNGRILRVIPTRSAPTRHSSWRSPAQPAGSKTGDYQPNPKPAFNEQGGALADEIVQPQSFSGIDFSLSTSHMDPQTGKSVPAPHIVDTDGKLSGQMEAWSVSWNKLYFNLGSPKPTGGYPGLTGHVTGTYNSSTHAYVLTWTSQVTGGPVQWVHRVLAPGRHIHQSEGIEVTDASPEMVFSVRDSAGWPGAERPDRPARLGGVHATDRHVLGHSGKLQRRHGQWHVPPHGVAGREQCSGPYFSNSDSSCSDATYTPLSPGNDRGLVTGTYEPEPLAGVSTAQATRSPVRSRRRLPSKVSSSPRRRIRSTPKPGSTSRFPPLRPMGQRSAATLRRSEFRGTTSSSTRDHPSRAVRVRATRRR